MVTGLRLTDYPVKVKCTALKHVIPAVETDAFTEAAMSDCGSPQKYNVCKIVSKCTCMDNVSNGNVSIILAVMSNYMCL